MTTTETAYIETFGCGLAVADEYGDYDHGAHEGDCDWNYRCGTCRTEDLPCAEHAPREFPGLMMADCYAEPKHAPSFVYANDAGYGSPCMRCSYEGERAAHDGCRHSGHRAWRRWKAVSKLVGRGYSLGVIRGSTHRTGGGCEGCVTFEWGRSSYLLGWDRWKWETLAHCLKRGHRPVGIDECSRASDGREMNFCVKCSPCPGCDTCQPPAVPEAVSA
jgi:hypothetical protein